MSLAEGLRAERVAERLLRRRGLKTVCRNYRCRWGELDLVMLDGGCLVVVEVRARKSGAIAAPEETVGRAKQARLAAAAGHLLGKRPHLARLPLRFDVVAMTRMGRDYNFRWLRDAFRT